MTLNKQLYDGIVAKERVNFGNYSFIKINSNLNYSIPKFRCCNGRHLYAINQNKLCNKGFFFK